MRFMYVAMRDENTLHWGLLIGQNRISIARLKET